MGNKLKTALAAAATLLVGLEGYGSSAYLDSAKVWTDCYGNTHDVRPGKVRTQQECKDLLNTEVYRLGSRILQDNPDIPTSVLVATISWSYNVGLGAYQSSTLKKRLAAHDWVGPASNCPGGIKSPYRAFLCPCRGCPTEEPRSCPYVCRTYKLAGAKARSRAHCSRRAAYRPTILGLCAPDEYRRPPEGPDRRSGG